MLIHEIEALSREVRDVLRKKLGVKGRTLAEAFRKAGRQLPKWARQQGEVLAEAEMKAVHPKLITQIDEQAVQHAYKVVMGHLATIDVGDRRWARMLDILGGLVFNLLLFTAFLLLLLWWRYGGV